MTAQTALYNYCLRLGDDALIQSYRLSEWCSNAPILEEDLALTNFALDMIGRAEALLEYAAQLDGKGKTGDDLAYKRGERHYHNRLITELPNGDFAYTMVRLLFVSAYEGLLYTSLQHSKDATLAAIAAKTVKESKYHLAHATDWVLRLGDGTEESHQRAQAAANELWNFTGELFETTEGERMLIEVGIAVNPVTLHAEWLHQVQTVLTTATLSVPANGYMHTGSSKGIHTEHLGHILSEMQYLPRTYPEAIW